ncbi:MAG: ABC transporter permease, partial [Saprospiraceae bacterium]|nr:ABC transporter permease [Saprospiraceae bacterium]
MNIYRFIAQRTNQSARQKEGRVSFSDTVSRVAVVSIAIGLALIMIAFCTLDGFKESVKNRIFSFGGHILISKISSNQSLEETPLDTRRKFLDIYRQVPSIKHVQLYVQKAGVIKAKEEVLGVIFKGIGQDYHTADFVENMRE